MGVPTRLAKAKQTYPHRLSLDAYASVSHRLQLTYSTLYRYGLFACDMTAQIRGNLARQCSSRDIHVIFMRRELQQIPLIALVVVVVDPIIHNRHNFVKYRLL